MTREEIIKSPDYWLAKVQIDLCGIVNDYMSKNKLSVKEMAGKASVKKKHIRKVLSADFNQPLEVLAKIALACGFAPIASFKPIKEVMENE